MGSIQCFLIVAAATGAGETVLLDFNTDSCVACRNMEPTIDRLTADGFPIRKVDGRRNPLWTENYRITAFPTYIMIADGREVERIVGTTSRARLLGMFDKAGYSPTGGRFSQQHSQAPDEQNGSFNLPNRLSRQKPMATDGASVTGGASLDQYRGRGKQGLQIKNASYNTDTRSTSAEQIANRATVRLKVEDATGYSFGTGTIIDTHGDEALILTCGHIFRQSQGRGRITVDIFDGERTRTVAGQLVDYDSERADIGFVTFKPGVEIRPVLVAPSSYQPERGTNVFSIGCNGGQSPSLKRSRVTAIDRYAGPPNIEVAGMPVNGRSGGGLFTADGMLIGVCNAADDQDNEGIYAALRTIHEKLIAINQSQISRRADELLAQSKPQPRSTSGVPDRPFSNFGSDSTGALPITPVGGNVAREIVVVIPAGMSDDGRSQTLVVPKPSPSLLRQLYQEALRTQNAPASRVIGNDLADGTRQRWPNYETADGEVLRGQSRQ